MCAVYSTLRGEKCSLLRTAVPRKARNSTTNSIGVESDNSRSKATPTTNTSGIGRDKDGAAAVKTAAIWVEPKTVSRMKGANVLKKRLTREAGTGGWHGRLT
jgi:hypothetical protein